MEKFRSKSFNLILYEDDPTQRLALSKIKRSYDYAMILHNMDTDENGVLKKEHYHVVLQFKNAKWNTALASELGIKENYIEEPISLKKSLLYLIHYYEEDKYHYDLKEVSGPLKNKLEQFILNDGKTESEKVLEIFEEIDDYEGDIVFSAFCKNIAKKGYWDVLRRSSGLIIRYLDEHNRKI